MRSHAKQGGALQLGDSADGKLVEQCWSYPDLSPRICPSPHSVWAPPSCCLCKLEGHVHAYTPLAARQESAREGSSLSPGCS